jgi:uroporphyrinogen-III synthase
VAACLDSLFQAQGRVLYVCGTLGDPQVVEALRVLGREVDVAVVYRNDSAARTRLPEGGHPTLLTFASPSAVRNFTESNLPLQPRWEALAIGPTTAEAARQAGFPVYQAAAPGVEALATAIHAWVNHQSLVT